MKCNVGGMDRLMRAVIGIVIIGVGVKMESWWGAIGAVPLLTAALGFCPAYLPFKISTVKKNCACEGCGCGK